ncbi:MAG: L-dopachrome tautomerase-related protein [Bacteroidota bacterium]
MNKLIKIVKRLLLLFLLVVILLVIALRLGYGGGREYPDVSTNSLYKRADLELYFSYEEPIGNVAATYDTAQATRVFFTIHPESRPNPNHLMEIVDGQAVPYPDAASQTQLFVSPLGVFVDRQNRLWVIDHGNHGMSGAQLTAFDLASNQVVHRYTYPGSVAEKLSFFNDLSLSPDGRYVFVADVSFFGKSPSLVVYDVQTGQSRSLLDEHPSVAHENYVPITPAKKMRFFGGVVDLLTGIDGLDVSRDGQYIYYAPMGHSALFRLPMAVASDFTQSDVAIAMAVERVATKPLSDGIRTDEEGRVYITDIEHQGIFVVEPDGATYTLIKDNRIRWADGMALAGDGYFYLADSDIPNQMLQSKSHIQAHAPYNIFRFKSLAGQH